MKWWQVGLILGGVVLAYEAGIAGVEIWERFHYYRMARDYCDRVRKPLLRVGMKRSPLEPPNGDVTLDIDPAVKEIPGGVQGDMRHMPFADKSMGCTLAEHVLEHLPPDSPAQDVQAAVNECCRVADYAILLCPSPYSIFASGFMPTHNLRIWFVHEGQITAVPNEWKTGLGWDVTTPGSQPVSGVGQVLIIQTPPRVSDSSYGWDWNSGLPYSRPPWR